MLFCVNKSALSTLMYFTTDYCITGNKADLFVNNQGMHTVENSFYFNCIDTASVQTLYSIQYAMAFIRCFVLFRILNLIRDK